MITSLKYHLISPEVFWITTANVASNIPGPLLDRMEIIELSSYMEQEKLEIAKRYLVPKQIEKNGLEDYKVKLSDAVLEKLFPNILVKRVFVP